MRRKKLPSLLGILFSLLFANVSEVIARSEKGPLFMQLFSSAFENQKPIPPLYSGEEKGISPPLSWNHLPEGTVSLALICDDPDAPNGTFTHWVLYDIPETCHFLPEALSIFPEGMNPKAQKNFATLKEGLNSAGTKGYKGPTPPSGTHRYIFTLYALDRFLNLPSGITKATLLDTMQGHIIAKAVLTGTYTHGTAFLEKK